MTETLNPSDAPGGAQHRVTVWDLPTRIFHWLLVALVATAYATVEAGGNWMIWHMRCGFAMLALLGFRIFWGVVGGRQSRFTAFVRGPSAVWQYARQLRDNDAPRHLGHNPMGGWSVMAMLVALIVQAVTGLFANDDIFIEGPLYSWVTKATSDLLTRIHRVNQEIVIALVTLHVGAIVFYLVIKKENLFWPMITGIKHWHEAVPPSEGRLWLAAVIATLSSGGVFLLVR